MNSNFGKAILTLTLFAAFAVGCSSTKKSEDEIAPEAATPAAEAPPQIESTPMAFDAQGSDSGKIAGLETVNFEYDKSQLSADAKSKIQNNVEWMKKNPKAKVSIEGHCDSRGSNEYNIALGERRAKSVRDYMVSLGIAKSRLSTVSYGKEKPIAMGDSESDAFKNRRANFVPN